jgi:hypothetical protein
VKVVGIALKNIALIGEVVSAGLLCKAGLQSAFDAITGQVIGATRIFGIEQCPGLSRAGS